MMDFCLHDLQKEFLLEFCRIEVREIALKTPTTEISVKKTMPYFVIVASKRRLPYFHSILKRRY